MGNKLVAAAKRHVATVSHERFSSSAPPPTSVDGAAALLRKALAPAHPGLDECPEGKEKVMEECPICMLFFPSVNFSRCCNKAICTQCFVRVGQSSSASTAGAPPSCCCPYCQRDGFRVEFKGKRSPKVVAAERAEEQRALERWQNRACSTGEVDGLPTLGAESPSVAGSAPEQRDAWLRAIKDGSAFTRAPRSQPRSMPAPRATVRLRASSAPAAAPVRQFQQEDFLPEHYQPTSTSDNDRLEELMLTEAILASLRDQGAAEGEQPAEDDGVEASELRAPSGGASEDEEMDVEEEEDSASDAGTSEADVVVGRVSLEDAAPTLAEPAVALAT